MNEHTYRLFDTELESIRANVLAMGGRAEIQFARAIAALGDEDDESLATNVAQEEQEINRMQMVVDEQCAQLIARRQPTAIDLRIVVAVSKIVSDLERVGDEIKKIAWKAAEAKDGAALRRLRYYDVTHAAGAAREMLQMALDAFARLDAATAVEIIGRDSELDAAFQAIMRQLVSYMMEDPRTISPALQVVFIAKSIERIGDHSKNIAESVVQIVKGKDVRHASAEQIRAEVERS